LETELIGLVPGAAALVDWFEGRWPSFHDAEVLGLSLDREDARCSLRVHAFRMTSQVDAKGYFVCDRHVAVTFEFKDVTHLELEDFNHQNAIYGLELSRTEGGGFRVEIEPAYGLAGAIEALGLRIEIQPGVPPGSQYGVERPGV
jgi:hypothetical protein